MIELGLNQKLKFFLCDKKVENKIKTRVKLYYYYYYYFKALGRKSEQNN